MVQGALKKINTVCVTVLLVGKQPACTGDTLADVCKRAQVGLLGLVAMFAQQRVDDLLLQVCFQLSSLDLVVGDHLCSAQTEAQDWAVNKVSRGRGFDSAPLTHDLRQRGGLQVQHDGALLDVRLQFHQAV